MLHIKNLHVEVEGEKILNGIDIHIKKGEMHAIMGLNGSGKSTLSNTITGRENYTVTQGDILYKNESILEWSPEQRALAGIFMSFQYPTVISGVNMTYFLRAAVNSKRKDNNQKEYDAASFLKLIKSKLEDVGMNPSYLKRSVNEGFSGGEKKRNEILQLLCLEPDLAIMDETDSGLDVDALKTTAEAINKLRTDERSFIIITHYLRLLEYIEPDYVHVFQNGSVIETGDKTLASRIDQEGYS